MPIPVSNPDRGLTMPGSLTRRSFFVACAAGLAGAGCDKPPVPTSEKPFSCLADVAYSRADKEGLIAHLTALHEPLRDQLEIMNSLVSVCEAGRSVPKEMSAKATVDLTAARDALRIALREPALSLIHAEIDKVLTGTNHVLDGVLPVLSGPSGSQDGWGDLRIHRDRLRTLADVVAYDLDTLKTDAHTFEKGMETFDTDTYTPLRARLP